jgi:DNA-binding phage protein
MNPLVQSAIASKILSKIFTSLKDGFLKSQENTGNLAKNLNISNKEAMELSSSMSAASFGSDALFLSSKGLTETLVEINKELGTSIQFSVEQLSTFTKLRETAGLTNEELMGINNLSLSNGKTFDKNADTILNQVSSLNRASKIYLNEKQVLKDISKLSSAVTLSLGKNPEALAKALATTKALGLEMSQLESIAGGLLDFESSIENELSAQLLTGKNINMELARQYALNNDYANLAKEINKQIGTSAEFTEMNSIGQEAMAKAVGMTREELAKTLFIQDQLKGASKEEAERRQKLLDSRIKEVGLEQAQKELREGGLDKMLDQATAAEKMAASMSKI